MKPVPFYRGDFVLVQSLPFGGVKDSGYGRFAGPEGLRACCLLKSVTVDRFPSIMGTVVPAPLLVRGKRNLWGVTFATPTSSTVGVAQWPALYCADVSAKLLSITAERL